MFSNKITLMVCHLSKHW